MSDRLPGRLLRCTARAAHAEWRPCAVTLTALPPAQGSLAFRLTQLPIPPTSPCPLQSLHTQAITFGGEEGTVQTRGGQAARRVQPLSKSSAQERQGVRPPARADAVDEVQ